jgi:hypothetical protein
MCVCMHVCECRLVIHDGKSHTHTHTHIPSLVISCCTEKGILSSTPMAASSASEKVVTSVYVCVRERDRERVIKCLYVCG